MYQGIRILFSEVVGEQYEDWSGVRSKGRALRRRKAGHKQRVVIRYRANGTYVHDAVNNTIIMHPGDRINFEQALRRKA